MPVILELTSMDAHHGYSCPNLNLRANVRPGKVTQIHLTPDKIGTFATLCDFFCGEGHENMTRSIVVEK